MFAKNTNLLLGSLGEQGVKGSKGLVGDNSTANNDGSSQLAYTNLLSGALTIPDSTVTIIPFGDPGADKNPGSLISYPGAGVINVIVAGTYEISVKCYFSFTGPPATGTSVTISLNSSLNGNNITNKTIEYVSIIINTKNIIYLETITTFIDGTGNITADLEVIGAGVNLNSTVNECTLILKKIY